MKPRKNLRLAGGAIVSALIASSIVLACSSNDNNNPTPTTPVYTLDGASNDSTVTTPSDDASEDATNDVVEEPIIRSDAAACTLSQPPATGSTGTSCWNCASVEVSDFLNHCAGTGVLCQPFDNTRLPGYDGGALPPLN